MNNVYAMTKKHRELTKKRKDLREKNNAILKRAAISEDVSLICFKFNNFRYATEICAYSKKILKIKDLIWHLKVDFIYCF